MKIIELLNKIVNDGKIPKRIKYNDYEWEYDGENYKIQASSGTYMNWDYIIFNCLNEEVEIIEDIKEQNLMPEIENFRAFKKFVEENKKELHANNIEFNINNDKRDCIITLDENDLGIDKLHLDNCYFYKENDKWYVKHINLKPIAYISQEHKIPEKLPYYSLEKIQKAKNKDEWREERISLLEKRINDYHNKINEILDYLEEIE